MIGILCIDQYGGKTLLIACPITIPANKMFRNISPGQNNPIGFPRSSNRLASDRIHAGDLGHSTIFSIQSTGIVSAEIPTSAPTIAAVVLRMDFAS